MIRRARIPILQMLTIGLLPSALKVLYYRLRGATIGKNVRIGWFSVLSAKHLEIGEGTRIGFGTIMRGREICIRRFVSIGSTAFFDVERIFIDDDAKINEQVFAGGPMLPESFLHIGKNTIVMQYSFLNPTKPLIIGDGTGVGGHCLLFTHGSWQSQLDGYPVTFAPITLGKNVWLPWRVFILPGVNVGDNVTIGANSLVTKDLPEGCLAAGVPAKVLRTSEQYPVRPSQEERRRLLEKILDEFLRYIDHHGFPSEKRVTESGWLVGVPRAKGSIIYQAAGQPDPSHMQAERGAVVLSLEGFAQAATKQRDVMWIDVSAASRTGSNELGEELVYFISRYGLRFYRTD